MKTRSQTLLTPLSFPQQVSELCVEASTATPLRLQTLSTPSSTSEFFRFASTATPQIIQIDFDEASRQWNKNKIKIGNGMYKYKKSYYRT